MLKQWVITFAKLVVHKLSSQASCGSTLRLRNPERRMLCGENVILCKFELILFIVDILTAWAVHL